VGGASALQLLAAFAAVIAIAEATPVVWGIALSTVMALGVGWLHQRATLRVMQQVAKDALHLAAGDLAHSPVTGAPGIMGHLQLALNQVALNLRTVVQDSRNDMENVRGAMAEIAAGNQDLSSRTESQASSLEQTAASMEEITGTVKQSAASAARGATLASETAAVSQRSHEAVAKVATAMDDIRDSSRRMGDIIQVIEGVAFQTNILALNAAVEAARAGEAGRGFAVVASEVRALAHRAADAAKQIRQLIGESAERVNVGSVQVVEANAHMSDALAAVHSVSDVLGEISAAAGEQQLGISQVNEGVSHMDAMTQQNAAMVEQLAAAASSVMGQVENASNTMRLFRLRAGERSIAEDDAVALRAAASATVANTGEGIDLREAIAKHLQWKTTLRTAALRGESLDVATIRKDDCCVLGQWLHGPGGHRWQGHADFTALIGHHRAFHLAAGAVAEKIVSGAQDEGLRMMEGGTAFAQATQRVAFAIKALMVEQAAGQARGADGAKPAPSATATPIAQPVAAGNDWESF
jgi:aerotaxis receptor